MVGLQVAESYLNQDAFYFPHNLDFRGRAYPMHPNLNHLGADLSRGLLQFADAKPLGPDGLRWLEISVSLPSLYLSTPVSPLLPSLRVLGCSLEWLGLRVDMHCHLSIAFISLTR